MKRSTIITGVGAYLPKKQVPNSAFMGHTFYKKNGERITKDNAAVVAKLTAISEIEERRYASEGVTTVDMAAAAAEMAIERAGIDRETIDQIIFTHNFGNVSEAFPTGDLLPNLAARLKHKLKIKKSSCIAYDMLFGCPGWVQGIINAHHLSQGGGGKRFLVIGADIMSRLLDEHDLDSMLFSDGAGAAIVESVEEAEGRGILSTASVSDCQDEVNYLKCGPETHTPPDAEPRYMSIKMDGRHVYRYGLETVPAAIAKALDEAGQPLSKVKKFLVHQANGKMIKQMIQTLYKDQGMEMPESVTPISVQKLGNSSVATIPTLWSLIEAGKLDGHSIEPGDLIVLTSVGSGMHANCVVYQC